MHPTPGVQAWYSAITLESQKSTFQKASESIIDSVDFTIADNAKQGSDNTKAAVNKKKHSLAETAFEYVDAAKESVVNAARYVFSVVIGATEGAKTGAEKK
ncbi:hypothetical protein METBISCDRAFT_26775 [Metschnikowia bicuspidata]|uniref:Uncharacterized protein n=1 Tax=Metschnikowia bicuspidata TaxID=27322 RepID=A0A4P9ZFF5_9ASCO|nr:hypothetical protein METBISCDRAFT_26775 [Metschnikowia bicuspidata]